MASLSPKEILSNRIIRDDYVQPRVYDAFDTTGGETEDIYNLAAMRALGQNAPLWIQKGVVDEEPVFPTLDAVLSKLGVKAENDPTGVKAARKFVDEFNTKRDSWKQKILRDPTWGKKGWDTVYDLFKKTSRDLMDYDIAEGRKRIASGEDDTGFGWLAAKAANIMFPRAVNAVEEGRDPTASEWGRDIAANAAYAVPVGRFAGSATRTLPKVAQVLAGSASQFAAPTAVALTDYAMDDNYDAGDLGTDVLVGGLTNLGVNRVLGPWLGNKLGALEGKVTRGRIPQAVREALEGGKTPKDRAYELISNSKQVLKDEERGLAKGLASTEPVPSKSAVSEASKVLDIGNSLNAPYRTPQGKIVMDKATGAPYTIRDILGIVSDKRGDEILAREADDVLGSAVQQFTRPATATVPVTDAFREGARSYAEVFRAHPELRSLFKDDPRFLSAEITPDLVEMLKTYAVNQFGSSSDKAMDIAGAALLGKTAKDIRKDDTERKATRDSKRDISRVLSATPGLTEEDRRYLGMVRENPGLLTFSQDNGLKSWLLRRGHELLRGTAAHRPTWSAK